jgi:predicted AlkP superfamily phosphohydrolase/phosphomutase
MTGVNPGQHGVFDFTRRVPGAYRIEFLNATYRQRPSAWRLLSKAGRRVGVMGLPATYPPEPLNGFLISGFDAPVATGIDRSFVHPPELYDEICRAVGPYEITDFQELHIGPGWHEMALRKLLHVARRRTEIAAYLLDRKAWDCFFVHFGESDTVAHHFWAFHDPASPRHIASADLSDAIHTVYRALDRAVGELVGRAGDEVTVMIVSDHGSGGTGEWVIHLNRWLAEQGWLCFAPQSAVDRAVGKLKRLGMALPAPLQEWAFRGPLRRLVGRLESSTRLGGIDWAATCAFSEEVNTCPGIWLNVHGREPLGTLAPGDYERQRDQIAARLLNWRHPTTGEPVIARAWRREELYHGPAVDSAPDIVLEPALDTSASLDTRRGYSHTLLPSGGQPGEPLRRLTAEERLGAKGGSMNGSHRPEGVFILAGAGARPGVRLADAQIVDVAPTLLHLLDVPLPAHLDGRVLTEALRSDGKGASTQTAAQSMLSPKPYSAKQAEMVDRRLRGLGYRT